MDLLTQVCVGYVVLGLLHSDISQKLNLFRNIQAIPRAETANVHTIYFKIGVWDAETCECLYPCICPSAFCTPAGFTSSWLETPSFRAPPPDLRKHASRWRGRTLHPRDHRRTTNHRQQDHLLQAADLTARRSLSSQRGGGALLSIKSARRSGEEQQLSAAASAPLRPRHALSLKGAATMVLIWTQFGVKNKNVNCKVRVMHRDDSSSSSSSSSGVSWTHSV